MNAAPDFARLSRTSIAVAAGRPHAVGQPINPPLNLSATFHAGGEPNYLRQSGSDLLRAFQEALGLLEGGQALGFSSGMAAIAAVLEGLPSGSTVVAPRMFYSGTSALLDELGRLGRVSARQVRDQ